MDVVYKTNAEVCCSHGSCLNFYKLAKIMGRIEDMAMQLCKKKGLI